MALVKEDVEVDEEISEERDDIHALLLTEDREEEEEKSWRLAKWALPKLLSITGGG